MPSATVGVLLDSFVELDCSATYEIRRLGAGLRLTAANENGPSAVLVSSEGSPSSESHSLSSSDTFPTFLTNAPSSSFSIIVDIDRDPSLIAIRRDAAPFFRMARELLYERYFLGFKKPVPAEPFPAMTESGGDTREAGFCSPLLSAIARHELRLRLLESDGDQIREFWQMMEEIISLVRRFFDPPAVPSDYRDCNSERYAKEVSDAHSQRVSLLTSLGHSEVPLSFFRSAGGARERVLLFGALCESFSFPSYRIIGGNSENSDELWVMLHFDRVRAVNLMASPRVVTAGEASHCVRSSVSSGNDDLREVFEEISPIMELIGSDADAPLEFLSMDKKFRFRIVPDSPHFRPILRHFYAMFQIGHPNVDVPFGCIQWNRPKLAPCYVIATETLRPFRAKPQNEETASGLAAIEAFRILEREHFDRETIEAMSFQIVFGLFGCLSEMHERLRMTHNHIFSFSGDNPIEEKTLIPSILVGWNGDSVSEVRLSDFRFADLYSVHLPVKSLVLRRSVSIPPSDDIPICGDISEIPTECFAKNQQNELEETEKNADMLSVLRFALSDAYLGPFISAELCTYLRTVCDNVSYFTATIVMQHLAVLNNSMEKEAAEQRAILKEAEDEAERLWREALEEATKQVEAPELNADAINMIDTDVDTHAVSLDSPVSDVIVERVDSVGEDGGKIATLRLSCPTRVVTDEDVEWAVEKFIRGNEGDVEVVVEIDE